MGVNRNWNNLEIILSNMLSNSRNPNRNIASKYLKSNGIIVTFNATVIT